jgi:hypothetical protein
LKIENYKSDFLRGYFIKHFIIFFKKATKRRGRKPKSVLAIMQSERDANATDETDDSDEIDETDESDENEHGKYVLSKIFIISFIVFIILNVPKLFHLGY